MKEDGWNQFIGQSQKLTTTLEKAKRMARSHDPILIFGQTGTGKSALARLIHHNSSRKDATFVEVPCSSLNENLIESELFGYVRGAYTGANQSNCGKLSLAHKGTIFLDEIGEFSLSAQCRLLHFLQEGYFYRLGSNKKEFVDLRIIAATNRNLALMVRQGSFRKDLYYRLAVLKVEMPPLCERGEDVLLIANSILEKHGSEQNHNLQISKGVKEQILGHRWPGNIRELQNVMKRAIICRETDTHEIEHIEIEPLEVELTSSQPTKNENPFNPFFNQDKGEKEELDQICEALITNQGCLNKAAKSLGLSRYSLYRRLKKYGLTKNSALTWLAQKENMDLEPSLSI